MINLFIMIMLQILGFAVIYIIIYKNIKKSKDHTEITEKIKIELNSIMVELNQITEQNIGLIEDKIKSLSELLNNADKKINIIKRETEKHQVGSKVYDNIVLKKQADIIASSVKNNSGRNNNNNTKEKVYKLFNEGFSSDIIAGKLGITVGEVDLIVSMKSRK